ncbi:MAG: OmpH family outer membrane protein [Deltaproteobacteria bacterium]|nr:MAG: OmpH family outer membrane protein [Deltaproteobacteria bacterium]TDJ06525.1 MAG: OmpH family outer membrane protein [Deltaproteobacteria bacterium]
MKLHGFSFQIAIAIFAGLLLTGPAAAAESVRIAVVNQQRALASSNEGRAAEKALKSLIQKKRTQLEPLEQELKRLQEEFESQKYVLSRSALEERKLDLLKRQRDLERSMREAEDDLEIENRRLMQPLVKRIEQALSEIGKEKDFTVILETKSAAVLYAEESIDITDLVIRKLNKKK